MLEKCTSQCSKEYWKYAINSIEQIIMRSNHVIISGEALESKSNKIELIVQCQEANWRFPNVLPPKRFKLKAIDPLSPFSTNTK
ncbi:hypothetical protein J25TS5_37230 [Paenibacillus faecis]|nr:hypothetical protein J25TS5_37230 [Paenibacillus faecis]